MGAVNGLQDSCWVVRAGAPPCFPGLLSAARPGASLRLLALAGGGRGAARAVRALGLGSGYRHSSLFPWVRGTTCLNPVST